MTYVAPRENFWLHAVQFLLPALAVGYRSSALIMRITRSALLEVLREDYVRTAWAKGQSGRVVDLAPRAEERHPARGHGHRHRVRLPDRRPGGDRDGVQPARGGALPRAGHPVARLPDRAEPGHVHRGRGDPRPTSSWTCSTASSTRGCAMAARPGGAGRAARGRPGAPASRGRARWTTLGALLPEEAARGRRAACSCS